MKWERHSNQLHLHFLMVRLQSRFQKKSGRQIHQASQVVGFEENCKPNMAFEDEGHPPARKPQVVHKENLEEEIRIHHCQSPHQLPIDLE